MLPRRDLALPMGTRRRPQDPGRAGWGSARTSLGGRSFRRASASATMRSTNSPTGGMSWNRPASWPISRRRCPHRRSRALSGPRPPLAAVRAIPLPARPALDEGIAPARANRPVWRARCRNLRQHVSCPSLSSTACLVGVQRRFLRGQEACAQQGALRTGASAAASPRPCDLAAITGVERRVHDHGQPTMLAIQPTCPPPSVPCATITSAPAALARSASGTVPAMYMTWLPASCARPKSARRS